MAKFLLHVVLVLMSVFVLATVSVPVGIEEQKESSLTGSDDQFPPETQQEYSVNASEDDGEVQRNKRHLSIGFGYPSFGYGGYGYGGGYPYYGGYGGYPGYYGGYGGYGGYGHHHHHGYGRPWGGYGGFYG